MKTPSTTRGTSRRGSSLRSLFLFLFFATACQRQADGPNVVLITLDTTRADRLGVMGDGDAKTPTLDALAARGVLFERAYSSAPLTLPSHTTILTGLDPNRHGVHDNTRFTVPPEIETVAERLASRGYDTAAFVGAFVLDAIFGLDQGFAVYDDDIPSELDPLRFTVPSRRGEETTDQALEWLARQRRAPFFLWVHYYDVHLPRRPPPPFDRLGDDYAGELAYVDAQLGRLLEGVNGATAGRENLIIVVGDHGESLGEHGEHTHGTVAYDSTLHVPLIVVGPGFPVASRSAVLARTADVTPTILTTLGELSDGERVGRPLQGVLAENGAEDVHGYFEAFGSEYSMGWARIGGVRTSRWKYTAEPQPVELYDVVSDPDELVNRAGEEPKVVSRLDEVYASVRAPSVVPQANPLAVSSEVEEKLAALGYVSAPRRLEGQVAPDPRRFVGALGWVESARGLALVGDVAKSIEALEILATSPVVQPLALQSLAPIYLLAGRTRDAIAAFGQLGELTGTVEPRMGLADALLAAGRAEDALREVEKLILPSREPSLRLRLLRARALVGLGRGDEAERDAAAVLAKDPGNDEALAIASAARVARDGDKAEINRLEELLRTFPDTTRLIRTRAQLAVLLRRARRDADAVRLLEGVSEAPPELRAILADIAADNGNLPKAAALYESVVAERPASEPYSRALIDIYDLLGRTEEAFLRYDALVAINPADATLFVDRGASRLKAGQNAEAEADFRRAIELDDSLPEAFYNLALIEIEEGRLDQGEQHLRRAVELRPDYAKAHFYLASLYGKRNDPRAAIHAELAVGASGPKDAGN